MNAAKLLKSCIEDLDWIPTKGMLIEDVELLMDVQRRLRTVLRSLELETTPVLEMDELSGASEGVKDEDGTCDKKLHLLKI
jgi:hypothetical protein